VVEAPCGKAPGIRRRNCSPGLHPAHRGARSPAHPGRTRAGNWETERLATPAGKHRQASRPAAGPLHGAGPARKVLQPNWALEAVSRVLSRLVSSVDPVPIPPRSGVWGHWVATPDCSARREKGAATAAWLGGSVAGRRPTPELAGGKHVVAPAGSAKRQRQQPPDDTTQTRRAFNPGSAAGDHRGRYGKASSDEAKAGWLRRRALRPAAARSGGRGAPRGKASQGMASRHRVQCHQRGQSRCVIEAGRTRQQEQEQQAQGRASRCRSTCQGPGGSWLSSRFALERLDRRRRTTQHLSTLARKPA